MLPQAPPAGDPPGARAPAAAPAATTASAASGRSVGGGEEADTRDEASGTHGLTPADRAWVAMAADMAVRLLRSELRIFAGEPQMPPSDVPEDAGLEFFVALYVSIFGLKTTLAHSGPQSTSLSRVLVALRDCVVLHTVAITGYRCRCAFMKKLAEMLGANSCVKQIQAELHHTYRCLFNNFPGKFPSFTKVYRRRRPRKEARGAEPRASSAPPSSGEPLYVRINHGSRLGGLYVRIGHSSALGRQM